jgi:hypothetical protein
MYGCEQLNPLERGFGRGTDEPKGRRKEFPLWDSRLGWEFGKDRSLSLVGNRRGL